MLFGIDHQITIRPRDEDLAALDVAEQRNREIADNYRRAYADLPQESWFAEASVQATGELLAGRDPSK